MAYITKEIKKGIKLHCIETEKFKTNLLAMFITLPLTRENVTFDSVIPAVLKRGTEKLKTQEEISKKLENMYGAAFDCGIEKIGDNHVIKFYLEALNDNFIPKEANQDLLRESVELLLDIILNPLVENNAFKSEYVSSEKENIKVLIESKIDNKDAYAFNRCVEEMYKDKPYGLYKYGYIEDLDKINEKNLYNYYKDLIANSKIDIFISGALNSIIKTIYRTKVSKEHLLEWLTAEEAEKQAKTDIVSYYKFMWTNVLFGILILLTGIFTKQIFEVILGVIWLFGPIEAYYLSKDANKIEAVEKISKQDKDYLLETGKKIWNFFNDTMNEENNFLPPDNYQEDRKEVIAKRTSPTNIGLRYACNCICL